ncbi:MAG: ABC transporter permease [Firmicutes bacterium HGW-Firmicutes-2]|nr:MAG: ABC transporter permease [Firmicutes bacterium HGW-Firmicutes-2]
MKTFNTMLKTEMKLSLRGMDMLIFAIFMPIIVLVVLGIIYGDRPAFEGASYTFLEQSFGAVVSIAISAGGVMGLPLVISDYRGKKILKRLKVTPAQPVIILLVQITIYGLYALTSLVLLYLIASVFYSFRMQGDILQFLLGWLLVLISMFSIGIMVGGLAKNIKIAGILASLLYFPMLIFSGATLPYEVMPSAMQKVADLLPLTQGIKLLKATSLGLPVENVLPSILVMLVIAGVCSFVSIRFFKWE